MYLNHDARLQNIFQKDSLYIHNLLVA